MTAPSATASPTRPAGTPPVTIPGAPAYFAAWMQASMPYILVGDTATGTVVGEVQEPRGVFLEGIYGAAADDRTFVAMGDRLGHGADAGTAVWYLLRIDPASGTPARLTSAPIPVRQNPAGVALSPDGSELAIALPGAPATLRVYSTATGALLRTWSATGPGEVAVESKSAAGGSSQFTAARVLRWSADGRQLAFAWNSNEIRVLDATGPSGNLLADSHVLAAIGTTHTAQASVSCDAAQGWELIANGHGVVCAGSMQAGTGKPESNGAACPNGERMQIGFLEENGGAQGGVASSLADATQECPGQPGDSDGAYVGWASPDGSTVIGSLIVDGRLRFGMFRDGRYTPLPALPTSVPLPAGVLIGTYDW